MKFLRSLMPAGLAGAFFLTTALVEHKAESPNLLVFLFASTVGGFLLGSAIVGLIRMFRVAIWAYPVVGLLSGPVPFAILSDKADGGEQWAGMWFVGALLGLVIGILEFARCQRERAEAQASGEN